MTNALATILSIYT